MEDTVNQLQHENLRTVLLGEICIEFVNERGYDMGGPRRYIETNIFSKKLYDIVFSFFRAEWYHKRTLLVMPPLGLPKSSLTRKVAV